MTSLHDLMNHTPGLPCRLLPDAFFSDSARERDAAVRMCRTCPLLEACAEYAISEQEPDGVWGGTTAADRRGFRDGRPWRFDERGRLRQVCGTVSAYHAHHTFREEPCEACTAAWEQHLRAQRLERLAAEHAKGGTPAGYGLHRRMGEPACALCLDAARRQSAAVRRVRAQRGRGRARSASSGSGSAVVLPSPQTGAHALPIAS